MAWERFSTAAGGDLTGSYPNPSVASGPAVPIGAVLPYAGTSAPTSWLLCAGQAVSRSTYSRLFSALGTTYGTGDGSTTFNLPDMRGRVAAGKDDMNGTAASRMDGTVLSAANTLGATGGTQTHTLTSAQIPAHTHGGSTNSTGSHTHGAPGGANVNFIGDSGVNTGVWANTQNYNGRGWGEFYSTGSGGTHSHTITTDSGTGGGGAHSNTQPTIVLNYIIRAL